MVVVGILGFAAIGSTATIVRMPYIKGFKATHDFLCTPPESASINISESNLISQTNPRTSPSGLLLNRASA